MDEKVITTVQCVEGSMCKEITLEGNISISPDGSLWEVKVANDGTLTTEKL
jgi:hypothetical protein